MGFNLTGTQVKDTYQRLAQISGSYLNDGTGSVITNLTVTSSYASVANSVAYTNITGKPTLVSGSAQIVIGSTTGNLSGSRVIGAVAGTVAYANITGKPALVSGSAQITTVNTIGTFPASRLTGDITASAVPWTGITGKPVGLVSGSSQISFTGITGKPAGLVSGSAQIAALGFATTGSNTFIGNQAIQGNVTFVSSSFISSNNQSGSIYISALNAGTVYLNSDGGEGNVNVGYNGWGGKLNVEGNVTIEETLTVTNIEGTGSLILQPNNADSRAFEIYNTSPADIHIKSNSDYAFFGDDTNYLKIDNPAGQVSIDASNRIFLDTNSTVIGDLNVSGTFYPNQVSFFSSSIAQTTGSYVLTTSALGVVQYDTYVNIAKAVQGDIQINSVAGNLSGSRVVGALGGTLPWASITAKGGVATTGSNSFQGNQTITGSLGVTGDIKIQQGSNLVTHHVKAAGTNGLEILNSSGGVTSLAGAGGSLGTTFYGQVNANGGIVGNLTGTATTSSYVSEAVVVKTNKNNTFGGNQTFNDITVNGTGSFAYLVSVTGSVKKIGDAFIQLNTDTPAERYAGIIVIDSGSAQTGSLIYDSLIDAWGYSAVDGHSSGFLSGPSSTLGSWQQPTTNKILKSLGDWHAGNSSITDTGAKVDFSTNVIVTGSVTASTGFVGSLSGNASTATSATSATTATSASYVTGQEDYARKSQSNIFTQRQTLKAGANITGSLTFNVTEYEGIDLMQGDYTIPTYSTPIRFYSGSVKKDYANNKWINFQTTPGTLPWLAVSSFPENSHFMYFQPAYTSGTGRNRVSFESQISGYDAGLQINDAVYITGSLRVSTTLDVLGKTTFSDQVVGAVTTITPASNTGSLDCSLGNFFTMTLGSGVDTLLNPSNIHAGQTINVGITQNGTTAGTISFPSSVKFAGGTDYVASTGLGAKDVLTLVSFDGSTLLATAVKNLS